MLAPPRDRTNAFACFRVDMNQSFAEQNAAVDERERGFIRRLVGIIAAGFAVNSAILVLGMAIVVLLFR